MGEGSSKRSPRDLGSFRRRNELSEASRSATRSATGASGAAASTSAALVVVGKGPVDDGVVDAALAEIRRLMVVGMNVAAHGVGEYLLASFFGGDPETYRSRKKGDAPSFDALLERPELEALGLSRTKLYNCIAVRIQAQALGMEDLQNLPLSHQVALVPAPGERKAELARKALDQGLTVKALHAEVGKAKAEAPEKKRRGRPGQPIFLKVITQAKKAAVLADSAETTEADMLRVGLTASRDQLRELERCIASQQRVADGMKKHLAERVSSGLGQ